MLLPNSPRNRRAQAGGATVFLFLFIIYLTFHAPRSPISLSSTAGSRHGSAQTKAARPFVEMQGLNFGKEFIITTAGDDAAQESEPWEGDTEPREDIYLAKVKAELLRRYSSMGVNIDHPSCSIDLSRYTRSGLLSTSRTSTSSRVTIALDLYNVESVLPTLSLALLELVYYLQPHHEVYISIYENDSWDRTTDMLAELAAALVAAKIDGLWFRHSFLGRAQVDRIIGLAALRNEALSPLFSVAEDGIVLFINDVITCGSDLIELAHQILLQDAHGVFSTDWGVNEQFNVTQGRLYDFWVARGINGDLAYPWGRDSGFYPESPNEDWVRDFFVTQDPAVHNRWLDGRPFPVYAGWNGAVALRAELFTKYHVRFRSSGKSGWHGGSESGVLGDWGRLLAVPGYLESDCAASECSLFARDVWNLLDGKARFVLASQSRTAYKMEDWERAVEGQIPPTRRTGSDNDAAEIVDWSSVAAPETVVCVPVWTNEGSPTDAWNEANHRKLLHPIFNISHEIFDD